MSGITMANFTLVDGKSTQLARGKSKGLAIKSSQTTTLIKVILRIIKETVMASCSTYSDLKNREMSFTKAFGSKDLNMAKAINLNLICSI